MDQTVTKVEEEIYIRKKPKGRPSEKGIKYDESYFKKYYHLTKKEVTCSCGAILLSNCMLRHLKRKVHSRSLMFLQQN